MQIPPELQRGQVAQRTMGPIPVIVGAPVLNHHPGVSQVQHPDHSVTGDRCIHLNPFLEDPLAVQGKLRRRIERHIRELFVFVSHPETPPDNNAAERGLRHLVISRRISGGARSEAGSDSKMTLASLFGAWRARGLNPLLECRRLLISPQL